MTDDYAIEGEDAGYVPCFELPAPLVVEEEGAIFGVAGGFVPRNQQASALASEERAALVGSGVGFVAKPCSCLPAFTPAASGVVAYHDDFDRTVALNGDPGGECEDWVSQVSPNTRIEIVPDIGMILHGGANLFVPEVSSLPIDLLVGIDPTDTADADLLVIRDLEGGNFSVATRFAMTSGPHTGETRLRIYRPNLVTFTDEEFFVPRLIAPYFMRIFVDDDALQVKIWSQDVAEPGPWTAEHIPTDPVTTPNESILVTFDAVGSTTVTLCGIEAGFGPGASLNWEASRINARSWRLKNTYATSFGGTNTSVVQHPTGSAILVPGSAYIGWSWVDAFQPAASAEMTSDGQLLLTVAVPFTEGPPVGTVRGNATTLTISGKVFVGQQIQRGPAPSGEGAFELEIFETLSDGSDTPVYPVAGSPRWSGSVSDYVVETWTTVADAFGGFWGDPLPTDDRVVPFEIEVACAGRDFIQLGVRFTDDFADLIATRGPWGGPLFAGSPERIYFIGFAEVTTVVNWSTPDPC